MIKRRKLAAAALTIALHGGLLYGNKAVNSFRRWHQDYKDEIASRELQYSIPRERLELIFWARGELAKGKLPLGDFILKANELDAREKGEGFDLEKVRKIYQNYLQKFKIFCKEI